MSSTIRGVFSMGSNILARHLMVAGSRGANMATYSTRASLPCFSPLSRPLSIGSPPGGGELTHVDEKGAPTMVDVGDKSVTTRTATAISQVRVPDEVMKLMSPDGEMRSAKGPIFATAIIAGTMAAKRTHDLIPFCHPLGIESCKIQIKAEGSNSISIVCTVKVTGKTGVEMEALTGASVAALTVYDMCKAVSHEMVIKTSLLGKTGGKSDFNLPRP